VTQLQSWNWLQIDFSQILSLLAQLHTPWDPLKQEPAGIDMWHIFRTTNEHQLEAESALQGLE
jgi:hypothetical protein